MPPIRAAFEREDEYGDEEQDEWLDFFDFGAVIILVSRYSNS